MVCNRDNRPVILHTAGVFTAFTHHRNETDSPVVCYANDSGHTVLSQLVAHRAKTITGQGIATEKD